MSQSLDFHAQSVRVIKNETLPALKTQLENHAKKVKTDVMVAVNENKGKITDQEGHSRRLNVIVNNLDYVEGEIPETVARDFCVNNLKIPADEVEKFLFRDVHRLPKARNKDGTEIPTAKKPLIMALLSQAHRNNIMSKAFNLKGTPFSIKSDLPKDLNDLRGRMLKERRRLLDETPGTKVRVSERGYRPTLEMQVGLIPGTDKPRWVQIKNIPT